MKSKKPEQQKASDLRKRAEKKLKTKTTASKAMSDKETQQLIHELQVHQIELEMQNDELRKAQAEVEESRTRYSDLYDFTPVGYFTFDKNGLILEANLTAAKELGVERGLLIKKPFRTYIVSKDRNIFDQHLQKVLKSEERQTCEIRLKRKDGSEFYVQLESISANYLKGNSLCRSSIIDMTLRKRTENALRESEERYRIIMEQASDAVFMHDETGRILDVNRKACQSLGYSREELLSKSIRDIDPEAIQTEKHKLWGKVLAGEHVTFESRQRRKDGSAFPVEVTLGSVRLPLGPAVLGIARDITERKRAEEKLVVQNKIANIFLTITDEEMYNEVLKVIMDVMQSPFGVFGYIDEDRALVVPTMTRQIWDKCQVSDKTFIFPRDKWGHSSWPQAIREKKIIYSNEPSNNIPEGHVGIQRHISLPFLFQGKVIGLFQVANKETDYAEADIRMLKDIAEQVAPILSARLKREQVEEEIRKLNAELDQHVKERTAALEFVNKELEAFSYSVSHDLRAPLRHIMGFVELLKDRTTQSLDEESLRYMSVISDSTNRMGTLIDDLLSFSRMGRAEMMTAKLNPDQFVKEAMNTLEVEIKGREIIWKVDQLPEVYGDPAMLRLVFVNLISNALKFSRTRPQAKIEIGCIDNEKEARFYVKDNGVGFDMQYADKLFGVFQRLHRSDQFEGTGVGLANVRRIIQRHGGRTWAEGKVDEGATFFFTLPRLKTTDQRQQTKDNRLKTTD